MNLCVRSRSGPFLSPVGAAARLLIDGGFNGRGALLRNLLRLIALAALPISAAASSQTTGQPVEAPQILRPFSQFTLDNGLTVLVREDHKLPIVSLTVIYQAGSRDDPHNREGMSHLIEHLLFYGSQHNPHNYLVTLKEMGITNTNGGTGPDTMDLIETVPVSRLDSVLWMESDRMGYLMPSVTQKTLSEQIEIIRNEINVNRDAPGGNVRYHIAAGIFPPDHPYHHEPTGDPQDLGKITLDEVRSFFESHYTPGNAAIVLAGDITAAEALDKVKRYFGGLPSGPRAGGMKMWIPELRHDKRERLFDNAPAQVFLTWPTPSFGTTDDVLLRLAGTILMDGKSSRVQRRLSAAGIDASDLSWQADARAIAGLFKISASVSSPSKFRPLERLIRDEITRLAATGPTNEELEHAKRARLLELRRLAQRTGDFNGQSDLLGSTWALGDGNAGLLDANVQQMLAATPGDVSAAVQRWLNGPAFVLDLEPAATYRPATADVDRSGVPPATAFKTASFPETQVATLPNGLKVHHARWRGGPVVVASLIVHGGAAADPKTEGGLARLTGKLLTAGSANMGEQQLTDGLSHLDATLDVRTDLDAITLTLVAPKEKMRDALDLLGGSVTAPAFPLAAVEREKKKQIEELQNLSSSPGLLSRAVVRRLLYGSGSAYAAEQSGLGTARGLDRISRSDIADYYRRWFNPANSELVIVGDIESSEAAAMLTHNLAAWSSVGSQAPGVQVPTDPADAGIYLIDRPGMEQADITVATLLDAPSNPSNAVETVMTSVLGDNTAGRIFRDLRDLKQWAYWARGTVEGGRAGQMLLIRTQVQSSHAADAIAAIRGHLEGIKGGKPISPADLQLNKDVLTLSLPLDWETDDGIANAISTSVRHGLPDDAIENHVIGVRAVTKAQVEQAARQILRPGNLVWLIIGDRSKIEPQLKKAALGYKTITGSEL